MGISNYARQMFTAMERRVALVTGSTSGIGLGVARALAARGCAVVLNGFGDEREIQALTAAIKDEFGVSAHHFPTDLSDPQQVRDMCTSIRQLHPDGVDVLINNAGFQHVSPVESFPDETWDKMLQVMLTTPFQLTKDLLPDMRKKGWGRIINIASVHGLRASPNKAAYVTAKHGIVGLTKVIALETAGSGVTCNAICPGYVDTPILQMQVKALAESENISYEEAKGKFLSKFHPSQEPVGIDHLGETVVYLCSDAASQMTGAQMVLDGGWTAK